MRPTTAAFFALLLALLPLRRAAAGEPEVLTIDEKVPMSPDGRVDVDADAGPVHVGQVVFQNLPTESEIREAEKPGETSRPRPFLVVTSREAAARLEIEVRLEDDQGEVLMSTENVGYAKKGNSNELVNASRLRPGMRTIDWPRLKVVHVLVKVHAE